MLTLLPGGNMSLADLTTVALKFHCEPVRSAAPEPEVVFGAILVGMDGRAVDPDSFVYVNDLESPEGSVTFAADGDEEVDVDLAGIPASVDRVVFVAYVDPDVRTPRTFAAVRALRVTVQDRLTDIALFEPNVTYSTVSALQVGELYRHRDAWKFRALGDGYDSVRTVAQTFGLRL
jgi:tellurium resistance protein TerD